MAGKTIKSVDKSVKILQCFYENEEMGISEIMNETGINKSTVFDLVNTLNFNGLLEQNEENKKYRLGVRLFELGSLYNRRNNLRKKARYISENLAKKYSATVHLTTHDKGEVIYLDKFEDENATVSYSRIGKRAPMSCTGVGKAMLAFLDKDYKNEYVYSVPLLKKTEHSITDIEKLEENLESVRRRGFAIDDEEIEIGIKCVACPIFNIKGEIVAAISVSRFSPLMTEENIKLIAQDVIQAAKEISSGLIHI